MRITRDLLHKFAREAVKQRQRSEPDLYAAYLTGSLLNDDPLLGGTTDIDLVLVHKFQTPVDRETEALTHEISLDIVHRKQEDYTQHRQLRQDPWLGYPLTHPQVILYDTDHWLEFIQSSASAEFHRSDNVLARVNSLFSAARNNWLDVMQTPSETHQAWLIQYLEILTLAANAISGLIGPPLATRRFMRTYFNRVETLGVPKIMAGFTGLLGYSDDHAEHLPQWINSFEEEYARLQNTDSIPPHLSDCRQAYYLNGIRALASGSHPGWAIWPLLRTWLDIRLAAPQNGSVSETWESMLSTLDLGESAISEKIDALDAYLDTLEITIESWADIYGI